MIVVMTTVGNADAAQKLAEQLVENRLAGCVQILPEMRSVYVWEGQMRTDLERLLLIKTFEDKYDDLERFLAAAHPYEVPEILAIDAKSVSGPYLAWMKDLLS